MYFNISFFIIIEIIIKFVMFDFGFQLANCMSLCRKFYLNERSHGLSSACFSRVLLKGYC